MNGKLHPFDRWYRSADEDDRVPSVAWKKGHAVGKLKGRREALREAAELATAACVGCGEPGCVTCSLAKSLRDLSEQDPA